MRFKDLDTNKSINEYSYYEEIEKRRIASELHDTSLQTLAHITNVVDLARLYIDVDPNKAKLELEGINQKIKNVIEEIRNTIYNLRPMSLDDLSFRESIEQNLIDIERKSKIKYNFTISDVDFSDEIQKNVIFRVIQECIINCEKHSMANEVKVNVFYDDMFHIIVEDDGVGFNLESIDYNNHFGLKLMKDKIVAYDGSLDIISEPNLGTKIKIDIPIQDN